MAGQRLEVQDFKIRKSIMTNAIAINNLICLIILLVVDILIGYRDRG